MNLVWLRPGQDSGMNCCCPSSTEAFQHSGSHSYPTEKSNQILGKVCSLCSTWPFSFSILIPCPCLVYILFVTVYNSTSYLIPWSLFPVPFLVQPSQGASLFLIMNIISLFIAGQTPHCVSPTKPTSVAFSWRFISRPSYVIRLSSIQ